MVVILNSHCPTRTGRTPSAGVLFGSDGRALTSSSTRKNGQQFRYYVSQTAQKQGAKKSPLPPLSALTVENMVLEETRKQLASPELLFQVWQQINQTAPSVKESDIRHDLARIFRTLFDAGRSSEKTTGTHH